MHPLVRDLYKRVLLVGRDYPTGLDHVKSIWKKAIRNPTNCPSWYNACENNNNDTVIVINGDEEELLRAVHKGRLAVKEMIGVIQLKKYRTIQKRYNDITSFEELGAAMARLEATANNNQCQN